MTLTCTRCNSEKEITEFRKTKSKKGYTSWCIPCINENKRERRKNPDVYAKERAYAKIHYERTKDEYYERLKGWREKNKEYWSMYRKLWAKENINYKTPSNRERRAKYRTQKENAMPRWIDMDHRFKIQKIYELAHNLSRITGADFHVDHIYPLKRDDCNGLHVWWNLRVVPQSENLAKSNKLEGLENITLPRVSEDCFWQYLHSQFKMYADLYRSEGKELGDKKPLG